MALSAVLLEDYRFQILHEVDEVEKSEKFPNTILNKWIHKDICSLVLRLGSQINQMYRSTASLPITANAGSFDASVAHTASSVTVTDFSGLTPSQWVGGSILAYKTNVLYAAQITANDATTVTISVGTDLPVLTTDPVFLTSNNAGTIISLSSLLMINYADPIWEVVSQTGVQVPKMNVDLAANASNVSTYDSTVHYYVRGQNVILVLGSGATAEGYYTIGYYKAPLEATADSNHVDLPIEYHDLAQKLTMVRILKKKGAQNATYGNMAVSKENELEKAFRRIDESNLSMLKLDQMSGERRMGMPV